jgi:predicted MarR family transcription regulator
MLTAETTVIVLRDPKLKNELIPFAFHSEQGFVPNASLNQLVRLGLLSLTTKSGRDQFYRITPEGRELCLAIGY